MLLSVIVPVYNAGAYLAPCLDSIARQTFGQWECWLVDDGSTDGSGQVCDAYAAADARFRVVHKPNGGVSTARNAGLSHATGAWVTFVDADDYVAPTYLATLMEGTDCELSITGHTELLRDRETDHAITSATGPIGPDALPALLSAQLQSLEFITPWGKAFRRDVIERHGLRFPTDMRMSEDSLFCFAYLRHVSTVYASTAPLYKFRLYKPEPVRRYSYAMDGATVVRHLDHVAEAYGALCHHWHCASRPYLSSQAFAFVRCYCRYVEQGRRWLSVPRANIRQVLGHDVVRQGLYHRPALAAAYRLTDLLGLHRWLLIAIAKGYTR